MVAAFFLMLAVTGLTLAIPLLLKIAIDRYIAGGDASGLALISAAMGIMYLALFGSASWQRYLLSWVGQRVLATLRGAVDASASGVVPGLSQQAHSRRNDISSNRRRGGDQRALVAGTDSR